MFLKLLDKHIKYGQLEICLPDGKFYQFGSQGPSARWSINTPDTMKRSRHRDYALQGSEIKLSMVSLSIACGSFISIYARSPSVIQTWWCFRYSCPGETTHYLSHAIICS